MKIVHLCLSGPYNDNWGYQDNLLPLYHEKLGHDVTVIATNTMHGSKGPIILTDEGDYYLENGLHIIRLSVKPLINMRIGKAYSYFQVYDLLKILKPDFIMIHGLITITALQAIKYKKKINFDCIIVADTHQDYNNSPIKNTVKNRIYFMSLRVLNKVCIKHYKNIYGITPGCIDYAIEEFKIPKERFVLLPLGCDTDGIKWEEKDEMRMQISQKYGVLSTDFIVVSGGKLDELKNTHSLIEAVGKTHKKNIKLIIFGSIADEYRDQITGLMNKYSDKVIYTGFLSLTEVYELYLAADLAVFPGSQSALWQQAIACGVPTAFKKWPKISYLDVGGNCVFLKKGDWEEIKELIESLMSDDDKIQRMKKVARIKGHDRFSYREIAKKSLQ